MDKYQRIKLLMSEGIPELEARKIVRAEIAQDRLEKIFKASHNDWRFKELVRIVNMINVR